MSGRVQRSSGRAQHLQKYATRAGTLIWSVSTDIANLVTSAPVADVKVVCRRSMVLLPVIVTLERAYSACRCTCLSC